MQQSASENLAVGDENTSLKGISGIKLHRDLGVTQTTAWVMLQRIREGLVPNADAFEGRGEVDEAQFGGPERKSTSGSGRILDAGRPAKFVVKDHKSEQIRAEVVPVTRSPTLKGFVYDHTETGSMVCTDEAQACKGLPGVQHEAVKHSVSAYVNRQAHINGVESLWAVQERAYHCACHHIGKKHLNRFVAQFARRQNNLRNLDTEVYMQHTMASMVVRKLQYGEWVAKRPELPPESIGQIDRYRTATNGRLRVDWIATI